MVLPIPHRLKEITSDVSNGRFESFVEVENLIDLEKLQELNCVEEDEILERKFYKVKSSIKDKAFEKFSAVPREFFLDFEPLFDKIDKLFEVTV